MTHTRIHLARRVPVTTFHEENHEQALNCVSYTPKQTIACDTMSSVVDIMARWQKARTCSRREARENQRVNWTWAQSTVPAVVHRAPGGHSIHCCDALKKIAVEAVAALRMQRARQNHVLENASLEPRPMLLQAKGRGVTSLIPRGVSEQPRSAEGR